MKKLTKFNQTPRVEKNHSKETTITLRECSAINFVIFFRNFFYYFFKKKIKRKK